MSKKNDARLRRARRGRKHIETLEVARLTVYRSPRHIYAQVISVSGDTLEATASTLDKSLRDGTPGNTDSAAKVERAKAAGIEKVAFDRSGYKYHGRIKALADAAREGGLQF